MKVKLTIEIDGNTRSEEFTTSEAVAHVFTIGVLNEMLIENGMIDKGNKLEVIDSDESALLSHAGY